MWFLLTSLLLATTPPSTATISQDTSDAQTASVITTETFDDFIVTPELEPRIHFWEFIFLELPSSHFLIHDIHYPELTYYTVVFDKVEDEKPKDTIARLKEFLKYHEDNARYVLEEVAKGNNQALQSLNDNEASSRILELKEKYPVQMATAHKRVHIQRGVADSFTLAVKRCEEYRPDIERTLREQHVPEDLYWLVFVESMCNPNIRSYAGAAGIWQLMPATARDFNLVVTREQDDRLNIIKATRASAKLFKRGKKMLEEWPLVFTGYNHGPAGVKRLTEEYQSTDLAYLIENVKKPSFGFASKNFYAEFIAVRKIGKALLKENEENND